MRILTLSGLTLKVWRERWKITKASYLDCWTINFPLQSLRLLITVNVIQHTQTKSSICAGFFSLCCCQRWISTSENEVKQKSKGEKKLFNVFFAALQKFIFLFVFWSRWPTFAVLNRRKRENYAINVLIAFWSNSENEIKLTKELKMIVVVKKSLNSRRSKEKNVLNFKNTLNSTQQQLRLGCSFNLLDNIRSFVYSFVRSFNAKPKVRR